MSYIYIVLSDGSIKAEEAHSSLLQSADTVEFTSCGVESIFDNPSQKDLTFDICQAYDKDKLNERKLVYDMINDYFKIITSVDQLNEVCEEDVDKCHLFPVKAKVIDPTLLHIEIVPLNSQYILNVDPVERNAPYGKISMKGRKETKKRHTIMKVEVARF